LIGLLVIVYLLVCRYLIVLVFVSLMCCGLLFVVVLCFSGGGGVLAVDVDDYYVGMYFGERTL